MIVTVKEKEAREQKPTSEYMCCLENTWAESAARQLTNCRPGTGLRGEYGMSRLDETSSLPF